MSQAATVTLVLPSEFIELCVRDRIAPEVVLRGFIADLCEITSRPQACGYCSHGGDERALAQEYYHRVDYYYRFDDSAGER
jgi:hypothetical protein